MTGKSTNINQSVIVINIKLEFGIGILISHNEIFRASEWMREKEKKKRACARAQVAIITACDC